jgi:hypothetical protein
MSTGHLNLRIQVSETGQHGDVLMDETVLDRPRFTPNLPGVLIALTEYVTHGQTPLPGRIIDELRAEKALDEIELKKARELIAALTKRAERAEAEAALLVAQLCDERRILDFTRGTLAEVNGCMRGAEDRLASVRAGYLADAMRLKANAAFWDVDLAALFDF